LDFWARRLCEGELQEIDGLRIGGGDFAAAVLVAE
jgi:hypothetical protein